MDETQWRLLDTSSISLSEEVSSENSPGAGAGDHQGRSLTPPRPLSLVVHYCTVVHKPDGEKAGAGCMWCVGLGQCWPHREEPPEAAVGPGARTGLRAPSARTAVREMSRGGFLPGCGCSGRPQTGLCLCKGTGRGKHEGELFSSRSCSAVRGTRAGSSCCSRTFGEPVAGVETSPASMGLCEDRNWHSARSHHGPACPSSLSLCVHSPAPGMQ